jgi:diaminohydroxyphosphoribosylaminopyrimidine deaminase/5-amino-6-(5-phosphoribosylamino)uracil reductase
VELLEGIGRVNLADMLGRLGELGIESVMVEGGGEVIASFVTAGLVDRFVLTTVPVQVNGYRPLQKPLERALSIPNAHTEKMGADTVLWGDVETH